MYLDCRQIFDLKGENLIPKFTWPAQSPDLNINENVWSCIQMKLSREVDKIERKTKRSNMRAKRALYGNKICT